MGISGLNLLIHDEPPRIDPHIHLSPSQARKQGCTCEFGCRMCGNSLAMMDACHSFVPCITDTSKLGREPNPTCPLILKEK